MGERSRAKDAELDEKDCELAEVRENMKELLHGYLAENARANKAGHELLKKLEEAEEAEARQAGEDLKVAMAKAGLISIFPMRAWTRTRLPMNSPAASALRRR